MQRSSHNDLSVLPQELALHAVVVGNDVCWPLKFAAEVVRRLAEHDQIVLGAEAWYLPGGEIAGGRTLDITWYTAEDHVSSPQGLVASCRDLALQFIGEVVRKRDVYIQIDWTDWEEWNKIQSMRAARRPNLRSRDR